ncbi:hypothetical protein JB92DRAFT_3117718 [Gautieria morchelliformis]|nr:hypothetical protein JB92DRAFT_3117718 [Gautieria morchelliformis]
MVYLWFSNTVGAHKSPGHRVCSKRRSPSEPPSGLSDASTVALQFTPSRERTLEEENHFTSGQPGSKFQVAVVSLMMGNKFVDDNTYTNKRWSDVSGIELNEINKMECEFLLGVDFRLYGSMKTYKAWVNLVKGLVSVKEQDEQQWQYVRRHASGVPMLAQTPRYSASRLKALHPLTFIAPASSNLSVDVPRTHGESNSYVAARQGAK